MACSGLAVLGGLPVLITELNLTGLKDLSGLISDGHGDYYLVYDYHFRRNPLCL
jgi:hypothetical protein